MIAAVIFDLDDTLYRESDYIASGFHAVAQWLAAGLPGAPAHELEQATKGFDYELWRAFSRDPSRAFDLMAEELELGHPEKRRELAAQMLSVYRRHYPTIELCEDARQVLPRLANQYRLGLVTDGDPERQRRKLVSLGIELPAHAELTPELEPGTLHSHHQDTKTRAGSQFLVPGSWFQEPRTKNQEPISKNQELRTRNLDPGVPIRPPVHPRPSAVPLFSGLVFTGTNPQWRKPSPIPFRLISYQLHCVPTACIYVADNPVKDFLGPRQIGMRTIRIRREGGLYQSVNSVPGGEPDETIGSLLKLPELLRPTLNT
jgi:FMN phosphatase YigB (HAD superfamily)